MILICLYFYGKHAAKKRNPNSLAAMGDMASFVFGQRALGIISNYKEQRKNSRGIACQIMTDGLKALYQDAVDANLFCDTRDFETMKTTWHSTTMHINRYPLESLESTVFWYVTENLHTAIVQYAKAMAGYDQEIQANAILDINTTMILAFKLGELYVSRVRG